MSLLSIVASSSAFLLPSSPPPKGSSIDSDWSIKNKKQPGFLRLISAWYAMVSLQFSHDDSASLPGLDPESRAPVPCSANQTAREQQPCQRSASCKPACWRTFGGQPNRIRVGKGSGDVSETTGRDPRARPFLWYLLAWNSAVGLSASFFSYHMLSNLATGFALAALHGVAVAAVRIVSAPLWGRAVDRFGARPVLVVSSFGIAAVPAIWLFPTPAFLWPLALEAALSGALWGGHGLAAMDLTVDLSPPQARPFYVAVFAAASGVGFAAASVLAGLVAVSLPDRFELLGQTWVNLHVLFFLSAVARAAAGFAALPIKERGALGVPEFLRVLGARAAGRLGWSPSS